MGGDIENVIYLALDKHYKNELSHAKEWVADLEGRNTELIYKLSRIENDLKKMTDRKLEPRVLRKVGSDVVDLSRKAMFSLFGQYVIFLGVTLFSLMHAMTLHTKGDEVIWWTNFYLVLGIMVLFVIGAFGLRWLVLKRHYMLKLYGAALHLNQFSLARRIMPKYDFQEPGSDLTKDELKKLKTIANDVHGFRTSIWDFFTKNKMSTEEEE